MCTCEGESEGESAEDGDGGGSNFGVGCSRVGVGGEVILAIAIEGFWWCFVWCGRGREGALDRHAFHWELPACCEYLCLFSSLALRPTPYLKSFRKLSILLKSGHVDVAYCKNCSVSKGMSLF